MSVQLHAPTALLSVKTSPAPSGKVIDGLWSWSGHGGKKSLASVESLKKVSRFRSLAPNEYRSPAYTGLAVWPYVN